MQPDVRIEVWEACRPQLIAYAARMVAQRSVAEELTQEAGMRLLGAGTAVQGDAELRAWLFKVVTNLALDHLKRHSTWRELSVSGIRATAERDAAFVADSVAMRGSPELQSIAREHLAVCFGCTLRNLAPRQAACLLLKEVYGLTVQETADAVDCSFAQVKNWLQDGRATLERIYARTCALVHQEGVCHQCTELDGFFNGHARNPLAGTAGDIRARLTMLRDQRDFAGGPWHRRLFDLVQDTFGEH
jgi:RNA polymerase sigma-70 factor (ECF subfamily)